MTNDRSGSTARHRWLCSAFLALGLASAAAMAQAQPAAPQPASSAPPEPAAAAAASSPDAVEGVTVNGRRPDTGAPIPDDKRAQFDQEAAREAAFRAYRESTPRPAANDKGAVDPNDDSKDFPGLQSYVPQQ